MKKNVMMRVAAILMVCVLATTCGISGTFAKYTTQVAGTDVAHVAHWGFGANTDLTFNLFTTDGVNVSSADGVIAPGTHGTANIRFNFAGKQGVTAPEVAYTFAVDAAITLSDDAKEALDENPNFYWVFNGNAYRTVDELVAAIEALSSTGTVAAGSLPANITTNQDYVIGWMWLFQENSNPPANFPTQITENGQATTIKGVANDVGDTAMGNANLGEIEVVITITATQVD